MTNFNSRISNEMKKLLMFVAMILSTPFFVSAEVIPVTDQFVGAQTTCIDLQHNMSYRSRDSRADGEVSDIQDFLNTNGYLSVEPTGYFGLTTVAAVKKFQSAIGIGSKGTPGYGGIGPKSRAKIKEITCGVSATSISTTLTTVTTASVPTQIITANTTAASAPTITFSASPTTVVQGGSTTLTWSSTNATSCSSNWGTVGTSGTEVRNLPYMEANFTLTCTGAGGSVSKTVSILMTTPVAQTQTCWNGTVISATAVCPVNNPTPIVEFVDTPVANLNRDAALNEAELTGATKVKITTGSAAISVDSGAIASMLPFFTSTGAVYTNSMKFSTVDSSTGSILSGMMVIPANTSRTFTIINRVPTKELFAGSYSLNPALIYYVDVNSAYQSIQSSSFINARSSNAVTIIGETSPYISSITFINNILTINGVRFNSSAQQLSIGGKAGPFASSNGTVITATVVGTMPAGIYPVQVIDTNTGASVIDAFSQTSTPTPAPVRAYTWTHNLEMNSLYRNDVAALQTVLTREGMYAGEVTGRFYSQTYNAVKAFQKKYGIDSTGFVGPQTRTKLNELHR